MFFCLVLCNSFFSGIWVANGEMKAFKSNSHVTGYWCNSVRALISCISYVITSEDLGSEPRKLLGSPLSLSEKMKVRDY